MWRRDLAADGLVSVCVSRHKVVGVHAFVKSKVGVARDGFLLPTKRQSTQQQSQKPFRFAMKKAFETTCQAFSLTLCHDNIAEGAPHCPDTSYHCRRGASNDEEQPNGTREYSLVCATMSEPSPMSIEGAIEIHRPSGRIFLGSMLHLTRTEFHHCGGDREI